MFDLMWVNSPYMGHMGFDNDDDDDDDDVDVDVDDVGGGGGGGGGGNYDDDDDFTWSLLFHGNSYATGFHGLISLRLQLRVRWWKFNKKPQKERRSSSKHRFSRVMLSFGDVSTWIPNDSLIWCSWEEKGTV